MGNNLESTRHWIKQRISSILLIPLTILFIYNFLSVAYLPYNEVITNYNNIFNLIVAFLVIIISLWHSYQGIEVVLEDYIHNTIIRDLTLKILKYLCLVLIIVVVLSFIILYRF